MAASNTVQLPDSDRSFDDRFNAELDLFHQEQDALAVRQLDQSINLGQQAQAAAGGAVGGAAGGGNVPTGDLVRAEADPSRPLFTWSRKPSSALEKILIEQQVATFTYTNNKESDVGRRCGDWLKTARVTEIAKALADQERLAIARFHESQFEHDKPDTQTAEFIPAPYVDPDNSLPMDGKKKKAFAGIVMNQWYDGNPNNTQNAPLYSLLMQASSFITEHKLSEFDSYQLLRTFLKGSALDLMQANHGSGVPFRSFWQTLQSLSGQTMNVETARQRLDSILLTPPKNLAKVFSEITRLHAVLVYSMNKKDRRLHRSVNMRKSAEELIERHYPWALGQILVKENSVKKSWVAERERLKFKGEPMSKQVVIYDVVNTFIGLAIQTCGNKDPVTQDNSLKDKVKVNSHPPKGAIAEITPTLGAEAQQQTAVNVAEMQPFVDLGNGQYAPVVYGYMEQGDQTQETPVAQEEVQEEMFEVPEGMSEQQEAVLVEALGAVGFQRNTAPGAPRLLTRSFRPQGQQGGFQRQQQGPQQAGFMQMRPRFQSFGGPRPQSQPPFQAQNRWYQGQQSQQSWQQQGQAAPQQKAIQSSNALPLEHKKECRRCCGASHWASECHKYSQQQESDTKCPTCGGYHMLDRGNEPSCISKIPLVDVFKMRGQEIPPELAARLRQK